MREFKKSCRSCRSSRVKQNMLKLLKLLSCKDFVDILAKSFLKTSRGAMLKCSKLKKNDEKSNKAGAPFDLLD